MEKQSTDWTKYYSKNKSPVSSMTQTITLNYLLKLLTSVDIKEWRIMECGGGNSCFAKDLTENLNTVQYDIIDNCELSIKKAMDSKVIINAYNFDLTKDIEDQDLAGAYNLVYSVGLVEHFFPKERKQVILNSFKLCRAGGYVLITAPTPTFKYRLVRKCMELFHVWQFWDEHPLSLEELIEDIRGYGKIIHAGINHKLPLTQVVVLVKKNE